LCAAAAAPAAARAEAFVSASAGRSSWDVECSFAVSCKKRDSAGTIRAGYGLSPYVGIEARYFDLGEGSVSFVSGMSLPAMTPIITDARISAKGGGVNLILSLPVAERFSVSGIAGLARTSARIRNSSPGFSIDDSTRATKPYYGVNVAYAISPALALSLEADRYRIGFADSTASVDMFGVGLTYRFR
jgi:opacity protein-like surface antigen